MASEEDTLTDPVTHLRRHYPGGTISQHGHQTQPPLPEPALRERLIDARADAQLVRALLAEGLEPAEPLADFLNAGDRVSLLGFWTGQRSPAERPPEAAAGAEGPSPADGDAEPARVYQVRPAGRAGAAAVEIVRRDGDGEPPKTVEQRAAAQRRAGGLALPVAPAAERPPLEGLFDAFAGRWLDQWRDAPTRPEQGPAWALALVSPTAAGLDDLLAQLQKRGGPWLAGLARRRDPGGAVPTPRLGPALSVDLAGLDLTGADATDRVWARFEAALLGADAAQPRQARARAAEALRELALQPLGWLWLGLVTLGLPVGLLLVFAALQQIDLAPLGGLDPADPSAWPAALGAVAEAARQRLAAMGWVALLPWLLAPPVLVSLWTRALNLLLPSALHLRVPGLHWAETRLRGLLGQVELLVDLGRGLGAGLRRLVGDPELAARRRWLRHRVFGSPLGRVDLALVVLRGLEWLPATPAPAQAGAIAGPADWPRALVRARGWRQGLLLITQTSGLSNLPSCFVDCWLDLDDADGRRPARWRAPLERALLVLDTASARLAGDGPAPGGQADAAGAERLDEAEADAELALILGLPDPQEAREGFDRKRSALLHETFAPVDLLAALVLGSAPAGQMLLDCRVSDCPPPPDWLADWGAETAPLVQALRPGEAADWSGLCDNLHEAFDFAQLGQGILYNRWVETPARTWRRLIGRPGWRRRLAAALRALDGDADARMARLVACGEIQHSCAWPCRRCAASRGQGEPRPRRPSGWRCAWRWPPGCSQSGWRCCGARRGRCSPRRPRALRPAPSAMGRQPDRRMPGRDSASICPSGAMPAGSASAAGAGRRGSGAGAMRWPPPGGAGVVDSGSGEVEATGPAVRPSAGPTEVGAPGEAALDARGEPPDLTVPAVVLDWWTELHQALEAPVAEPALARAGRTYCAFLAAVASWDAAGAGPGRADGYPIGLGPLLAGLRAALDGAEPSAGPAAVADPSGSAPTPPAPADSIRGRFEAEARALAQTLALVDEDIAAQLLDERLRQDWSPLPGPFRDLLRARCPGGGGALLIGQLAAAADEQGVLAVAARWRLRPLTVIAALAWTALEQGRDPRAGARPCAAEVALPVARFVAALRARLPSDQDPEPLPRLLPPPGFAPGQGGCVAALVADPGFVERLAPRLVAGDGDRRKLRQAFERMGRIDLDGIALGSRSPANRLIARIEEIVELPLG